jgi:hypothetical protein
MDLVAGSLATGAAMVISQARSGYPVSNPRSRFYDAAVCNSSFKGRLAALKFMKKYPRIVLPSLA